MLSRILDEVANYICQNQHSENEILVRLVLQQTTLFCGFFLNVFETFNIEYKYVPNRTYTYHAGRHAKKNEKFFDLFECEEISIQD